MKMEKVFLKTAACVSTLATVMGTACSAEAPDLGKASETARVMAPGDVIELKTPVLTSSVDDYVIRVIIKLINRFFD
jgi:hypothetical protein